MRQREKKEWKRQIVCATKRIGIWPNKEQTKREGESLIYCVDRTHSLPNQANQIKSIQS